MRPGPAVQPGPRHRPAQAAFGGDRRGPGRLPPDRRRFRPCKDGGPARGRAPPAAGIALGGRAGMRPAAHRHWGGNQPERAFLHKGGGPRAGRHDPGADRHRGRVCDDQGHLPGPPAKRSAADQPDRQ